MAPSWRWASPAEKDALRAAVDAIAAGQLPPGLAGVRCTVHGMLTF